MLIALTVGTLLLLAAFAELGRRTGVRGAWAKGLAFAIVVVLGSAMGTPIVAIGVDVAILLVLSTMYLPMLGLVRLARDLERTRTRAAADAVIAYAEHAHPAIRFTAAVKLANTAFWRDADRLLARLESSPSSLRPRILLQAAMVKIALDDLDASRALLARIADPAAPAIATVKRITEARILSQEGHGPEALALLGPALPADPAIALYARVVRAHAHAANGDREAARAALREIADRKQLARAADSNGPAAPIAAELLADASAPYR